MAHDEAASAAMVEDCEARHPPAFSCTPIRLHSRSAAHPLLFIINNNER